MQVKLGDLSLPSQVVLGVRASLIQYFPVSLWVFWSLENQKLDDPLAPDLVSVVLVSMVTKGELGHLRPLAEPRISLLSLVKEQRRWRCGSVCSQMTSQEVLMSPVTVCLPQDCSWNVCSYLEGFLKKQMGDEDEVAGKQGMRELARHPPLGASGIP